MQKTISVLCASAALALAASVLVTVPASANGGDFFNELAESWGANADTGTPFFGFVRDARGKPIPRAIVTATVQRGLDGESVTIISDNLGHYRIPGPRQGHPGEGRRDRVRQGGLSRRAAGSPHHADDAQGAGRSELQAVARSQRPASRVSASNSNCIAIAAMKLHHCARGGVSS